MSLDQRNEVLNEKLEDNPVDEQIKALIRADRFRKLQVFLLFVIVIALAYGLWQIYKLTKKAETNRNAIVARCELGNEHNNRNHSLWHYIIDLTPAENRTAEQRKQVKEFHDFVHVTFAESDCMAVIEEAKD